MTESTLTYTGFVGRFVRSDPILKVYSALKSRMLVKLVRHTESSRKLT